jgi:hypothetical protein
MCLTGALFAFLADLCSKLGRRDKLKHWMEEASDNWLGISSTAHILFVLKTLSI